MALNPNAPLDREGLDEAVQAVWSATRIVLACHVNPDGDAIGSMLGFGLGLEALGKEVTYLSADGVPETLAFLPGIEKIQTHTDRRDFGLGVGLDAGLASGLASFAVFSPLVIDDSSAEEITSTGMDSCASSKG